jgi:hypothetical protein
VDLLPDRHYDADGDVVDRTAAVRFRVPSIRLRNSVWGDEGDGTCVVLQFLVGMPSGIGRKLKEGTSKLLHLEHSIVGC